MAGFTGGGAGPSLHCLQCRKSLNTVAPCNRTIEGRVNYVASMSARPRYYADDASRDVLALDPRPVRIGDARLGPQPPSLDREGFALFRHRSAIPLLGTPEEAAHVHRLEAQRLILELTSADRVVLGSPAVRRVAHRGPGATRLTCSDGLYSTRPVSFAHIDVSDSAAAAFGDRWRPRERDRRVRRVAHYNIWRVLSPPPQDLPLALCDSRTVLPEDLVEADAMMDIPGKRESSYVGLVIRYSPRHRWSYFPDMHLDEVLVFKTHDSDPCAPCYVPHAAVEDPSCSPTVAPRASIEARAIAYWFAS